MSIVAEQRKGGRPLSRCSLYVADLATSAALYTFFPRYFLFTRGRKADPIREGESSLGPTKSRRNEEREREGEGTRDEKGGEASQGLHRFLNLFDRCAGTRGERGDGGSARKRSGGSFRICPIENLSDVHGVSSSRHFYWCARARACARCFPSSLLPPPTLLFLRLSLPAVLFQLLYRLLFKGASFCIVPFCIAPPPLSLSLVARFFFVSRPPAAFRRFQYNSRLVNNSGNRMDGDGGLKEIEEKRCAREGGGEEGRKMFYLQRCYKLFRIAKNSRWTEEGREGRGLRRPNLWNFSLRIFFCPFLLNAGSSAIFRRQES